MKTKKPIKGYKAFTKELKCQGFQFAVGETFEVDGEPVLCKNGFHFCERASDVFNYYSFTPETRVCEIEALGKTKTDDNKSVTTKIHIVREISRDELLQLVNTGAENTGCCNSGNRNSGHYNSGHYNSGYRNSGHYNSGDYNSGNRNSGHYNSGNNNSSHYNSGNNNSGHYNSGNNNCGYRNSGHYNSGNRNSGHYNSGDYNSGLFNTNTPNVRLFNVQTKLKWNNPHIQAVLKHTITLTEWIESNQMTDAEKAANPNHEITGGFLKTIPYKEAWLNFWVNASDETRADFIKLPHFNAKIFQEITGIDITKKYTK